MTQTLPATQRSQAPQASRKAWAAPFVQRTGSVADLVLIHKLSGGNDNCPGSGVHWSSGGFDGNGQRCP